MPTPRWFAATAAAIALVGAAALVPRTAASAAPPPPRLPQVVPAIAAGRWLAGQLLPAGYVPTAAGPGHPDYSSTAQTILALAAANVDLAGAGKALAFMQAHMDQYVPAGGSDGPGKLAVLVLDAVALGASPTDFGGSDLVSLLLATEQQSGPDTGLFGTEAQVDDYDAGGYQQGLALAALAAAGVRGTPAVRSAVAWLERAECPDGGWTTPDSSVNPCNGSPADFSGPDTNSTALAAEGLAAQTAAPPAVTSRILAFFASAEDPDGGWSYFPNTRSAPGATDPDSTALVVQALLALHSAPAGAAWRTPGGDPLSALLAFQLRSGSGKGALYFPPAPSPASIIATYQAVPALAGLAFPYGADGRGYWLASAGGGVTGAGSARYTGSPAAGAVRLAAPVVGIAATPDGSGYWLAAADGGVFAYGDARFYGSAGAVRLAAPVVGIAATPDGGGYWLAAADGGVFAYGDARFYGSAGAVRLAAPVVGIAATPDGGGYWLAAADGGVFAYGDARFYGSAGAVRLAAPVVGIAATPDGGGYWLAAADGGVFAYGDARFYGSAGAVRLAAPVVGIAATPDGGGYWLLGDAGTVLGRGDAGSYVTTNGTALDGRAVCIAAARR